MQTASHHSKFVGLSCLNKYLNTIDLRFPPDTQTNLSYSPGAVVGHRSSQQVGAGLATEICVAPQQDRASQYKRPRVVGGVCSDLNNANNPSQVSARLVAGDCGGEHPDRPEEAARPQQTE
jgi:hypothetical protein